MYPRTVHKPTFKPSRKKTTEYPKPWKGTTRLFQGHTIPHGLRLGILSNAGNHWFLHGWITPVLGHRYGGQCKKEPVLEEPDLVCLDWKVRRFKEKYDNSHNHLSSGRLRLLLLGDGSLNATRTMRSKTPQKCEWILIPK